MGIKTVFISKRPASTSYESKSFKPENGMFKVGGTHTLKLSITWPSNSLRYLIKVPKVRFPKGLEPKGVTSTTSFREGQSVLEYHYPFELKRKRGLSNRSNRTFL